MVSVKVKDSDLRNAAAEGIDSFVGVFVNAIKESIGGELNAENMPELGVEQITLLAYDILHGEVMDGGFVQLIHNGYGGFIFFNPFAKVVREWGLDDLAALINKAGRLYRKTRGEIECECTDEEFMAMFEQHPEFDDLDDKFVENEKRWTAEIAHYIDEHIDRFAVIEDQ